MEKIIQFGDGKAIHGVVGIPVTIGESKPTVIILNSGLVHKIGPNRMAVTLSRQLVNQGYAVLRFDLPGIGDSITNKNSLNYKERTTNQIASAMDAIEKNYQQNKFVVIGLCTGAINSHSIATVDDRVKGAFMIDAYSYPTMKFLYKRYRKSLIKLLSPIFMFHFIKSKLSQSDEFEDGIEGLAYWELPSQQSISNDLKVMMKRDVQLMYLYTGGVLEHFNYENQLRDNFKNINFKNNLTVYFRKIFDHTFSLNRDRDEMITLVCDWLKEKF